MFNDYERGKGENPDPAKGKEHDLIKKKKGRRKVQEAQTSCRSKDQFKQGHTENTLPFLKRGRT